MGKRITTVEEDFRAIGLLTEDDHLDAEEAEDVEGESYDVVEAFHQRHLAETSKGDARAVAGKTGAERDDALRKHREGRGSAEHRTKSKRQRMIDRGRASLDHARQSFDHSLSTKSGASVGGKSKPEEKSDRVRLIAARVKAAKTNQKAARRKLSNHDTDLELGHDHDHDGAHDLPKGRGGKLMAHESVSRRRR